MKSFIEINHKKCGCDTCKTRKIIFLQETNVTYACELINNDYHAIISYSLYDNKSNCKTLFPIMQINALMICILYHFKIVLTMSVSAGGSVAAEECTVGAFSTCTHR